MLQLEKDVEQTLVRMVKRHGGLCLKWVCPGWSGVPDRIILLPGGLVLFAETKRPNGGKLSKLQKWWRDQLQRLGFRYWLIWNRKDIDLLELFVNMELSCEVEG